MGNSTLSTSLGIRAFEGSPLELQPSLGLRPDYAEDEIQLVIRTVYRQVLGNVHIMESQRLSSAESLLRNGDFTVREFVRAVAQSDLYSSLFFETSSPYRFIELNFKHLLGRAPLDQAEIAEHVLIYQEQGYSAEINSYLDSEEYSSNFGDNIVPYLRSIQTQVGIKNEGFNRMFSLLGGAATSDVSQSAQLISSLAANSATPIKSPVKGNSGTYDNTGKRFKIAFTTSKFAAQAQRFSQQSRIVSYELMSETVQNIHRYGGRILNISEVA